MTIVGALNLCNSTLVDEYLSRRFNVAKKVLLAPMSIEVVNQAAGGTEVGISAIVTKQL